MNSGNFTTFFIGHGDNIGDVVFTLNVVVGELSQPAFKIRAIGDQNPGINFLNPALLVAGVLMLDNARHLAVQHQDIFIIAEERRRLLHGVAGT